MLAAGEAAAAVVAAAARWTETLQVAVTGGELGTLADWAVAALERAVAEWDQDRCAALPAKAKQGQITDRLGRTAEGRPDDSVHAARTLRTAVRALWVPSADGDAAVATAAAAIADARPAVVRTLQDLCERAGVAEAVRRTALDLLGEVVPRDVPETTWVLVRAMATLVQPAWPDVQVRTGRSATERPAAGNEVI